MNTRIRTTLLRAGMMVAVLVLAGCLYLNFAQSDAPDPTWQVTNGDNTAITAEVITDDLQYPWGMAFLPDGSILVTERAGNLRRIVSSKVSAPIKGLPAVARTGQGGLLDIALDPEFVQNRWIYFSYSEPSADGKRFGTAVSRGKINLTELALTDLQRLFTSNKKSSNGRHFGSRLRFAADNTLFITLGDRGDQPRAQDPFDHAGSVIRINRDGSVPADNPYADGQQALSEIWSTGHRNPQGAAIDSNSGTLWTLSHGARGGDEINKVQPGLNYGWPLISYGTNYSGTGFKLGYSAEGYEQPEYYWDPSIAPSGLAYYDADNLQIPRWKGSLLAGALKGQYLSRLIIGDGKIIGEEKYLVGQVGRIRDVRLGPGGAVWLLTDSGNGQLIRLTGNE